MKILITGFEPFGKNINGTNSSWESVCGINEKRENSDIIKIKLPVKYRESFECLKDAISLYNPRTVICVGQAEGRIHITPEFVAMNRICSAAPDNSGSVQNGTKVREDGAIAYLSSLPVKSMVKSMQENGISASLSYDAGGYVCNALMYNLLYYVEKHKPMLQAGFIHVPKYCKQDEKSNETNSMMLEDITKGLELCIKEILKNTQAKENFF